MRRLFLATTVLAALTEGLAHGQAPTQNGKSTGIYQLGEVVVAARDRTDQAAGGAVVQVR